MKFTFLREKVNAKVLNFRESKGKDDLGTIDPPDRSHIFQQPLISSSADCSSPILFHAGVQGSPPFFPERTRLSDQKQNPPHEIVIRFLSLPDFSETIPLVIFRFHQYIDQAPNKLPTFQYGFSIPIFLYSVFPPELQCSARSGVSRKGGLPKSTECSIRKPGFASLKFLLLSALRELSDLRTSLSSVCPIGPVNFSDLFGSPHPRRICSNGYIPLPSRDPNRSISLYI